MRRGIPICETDVVCSHERVQDLPLRTHKQSCGEMLTFCGDRRRVRLQEAPSDVNSSLIDHALVEGTNVLWIT